MNKWLRLPINEETNLNAGQANAPSPTANTRHVVTPAGVSKCPARNMKIVWLMKAPQLNSFLTCAIHIGQRLALYGYTTDELVLLYGEKVEQNFSKKKLVVYLLTIFIILFLLTPSLRMMSNLVTASSFQRRTTKAVKVIFVKAPLTNYCSTWRLAIAVRRCFPCHLLSQCYTLIWYNLFSDPTILLVVGTFTNLL